VNQAGPEVLTAIFEIARELPPPVLGALATELQAKARNRPGMDLGDLGASQKARERIRALTDLMAAHPDLDHSAIALAIQACAHAAMKLSSEQRVEIAWTGPGTRQSLSGEWIKFSINSWSRRREKCFS
jgi:hypothetical protein